MEAQTEQAHDEWSVIIDGKAHKIFHPRLLVAELFDLAEKSPHEWTIETEVEGGARVTLGTHDHIDLVAGRPAAFFTRERHHKHRSLHLVVIVNSQPIPLQVEVTALLATVLAEAFERGKPAGRAEDEFELKTAEGDVLDLALTVGAAGIEEGATLFLSLKVGAAGEVASELLVDPAVSRAKFDGEIAAFRGLENLNSNRGIWLIRAEYPQAALVFAAPNVKPLRLLAFGAVISFENYDLWAPSVRIVDPLTEIAYRGAELPPQAQLLRRQSMPARLDNPTSPQAIEVGKLMQWHLPGDIPFLCHPGVREYHAHPAHTGDPWLLHRGRGEGTLARIVELLYQYGSSKMLGFNISPALSMPDP